MRASRTCRVLSGLALLLLPTLIGCGGTPEEKALEDIRDTTIIPNLGSYDDQIQQEAVYRMQSILENAPEVARNLLAATLRDPVYDNRTKLVCAWLLATQQDRRALQTLVDLLGVGSDSDESLLRDSLNLYGAEVVPSVASVLREGNDVARIAAAEVLCDLGDGEAVDALVARYGSEPNPRVRFLILCGVANRPPLRVPLLEQALVDADAKNRDFAWSTLGRHYDFPETLTFDAEETEEVRSAQLDRYRRWLAGRL
ncbi:MAG: HEAT repeat domain-containing protein [Planctomycetota bacterium]